MGLKICSLSSGSSGNCIYIASDTTKLIIDSGVPVTRVEKSLQVLKSNCSDLSVLVTHNHVDHIGGVPVLNKKYDAAVYSHFLSATLKNKLENSKKFVEFGDGDFYIGDMLISPFKVSHDVPTVGFQIYNKQKKISVLTDLGHMTDSIINSISDSDLVLIECNHDEEILKNNPKYHFLLKRRILSDNGHLSNSSCADAVVALAKNKVKQIILAHLSEENNYPELAYRTVADRLRLNGFEEGKDISIEVAPKDRMSGLYEVV